MAVLVSCLIIFFKEICFVVILEREFYLGNLQKHVTRFEREFGMNKQLRDLQARPVCVEGGGELYRPSKLGSLSLVMGVKMIKFVSSGQLLLDSVEQRNVA